MVLAHKCTNLFVKTTEATIIWAPQYLLNKSMWITLKHLRKVSSTMAAAASLRTELMSSTSGLQNMQDAGHKLINTKLQNMPLRNTRLKKTQIEYHHNAQNKSIMCYFLALQKKATYRSCRSPEANFLLSTSS